MRHIELLGVPYTSMAAPGGIADGICALRTAGLLERLTKAADVIDAGDLDLEEPSGRRGPAQLLNEAALVHLFHATREAVAATLERDRLPLLVGGDCPALLGPLAALRDRHGEAALLMLDGHEDAWPPQLSPTGEASDSEIAIALGLVSSLPAGLAAALPLVAPEAIAMLGPRDAAELAGAGVASLGGCVGLFLGDGAVHDRGLANAAAEGLDLVRRAAPAFWLHVDLDVLRTDEFPAATREAGARRINYEVLGNGWHHLHGHVHPRYEWEPRDKIAFPVWRYPDDLRNAPEHEYDDERHGELRALITHELGRVMRDAYAELDASRLANPS